MADTESEEGSVKREVDEEQRVETPEEVAESATAAADHGEDRAAEEAHAGGTDTDEGGEAEVPDSVGGEKAGASSAQEGAEEDTGTRIEETPDTGEVAEIVLVITSLGSIRRQFFSSQRTKNFLDCKGVVYVIVDSNRDTSTAKSLRDIELFKEWKENRILKATPETEDSADPESLQHPVYAGKMKVVCVEATREGRVIIPQVLVDGVVVGSETTLQDLEEDGDLDWIFSRAACPNCLREKSLSALECESCGVVFRSLIPPNYIAEGHVLQMLQGCPYNEEEAPLAEGGGERPQQQRWGMSSQQSLAADVDFGDFEEEEGDAEPEDAAARALQAAVKAEAEAEAAARRASMESAAAAAAGPSSE